MIESPDTVRLYAGCGIVDGSQPEAELAETWAKFRPMLESLGIKQLVSAGVASGIADTSPRLGLKSAVSLVIQ